jgi:hypothetical protein
MKGAQTWTLQKENNMELRDCYSQAHFSGKQSYATAWKYTDL